MRKISTTKLSPSNLRFWIMVGLLIGHGGLIFAQSEKIKNHFAEAKRLAGEYLFISAMEHYQLVLWSAWDEGDKLSEARARLGLSECVDPGLVPLSVLFADLIPIAQTSLALDLFEQIGNAEGIAMAKKRLGALYVEEGDNDFWFLSRLTVQAIEE